MSGINDTGVNCTGLYDHRHVARVLIPIYYSFVFIVGFLGNMLALYVIVTHRTKINSTTLYSANLAASDILFTISLPLRAVYYGLGFHWPLRETLCKITSLLFYLNTYAGVNFMTCLAVDRFIAIVLPRHFGKLQNVRKVQNVRFVCLTVWLLVLAQTLPLLSMPMIHQEPDGSITCMEYPNFEGAIPGLPYMLIGAVVLGYGIPVVTILTCYSVLWHKLRSLARDNTVTEKLGRSQKAIGVIAGVVLVFLVCFTPYHIDLLQFMIRKLVYQPSCSELQYFQVSLHITVCLMNLNSCLDPFVYFFACKGYKRQLLSILKRKGKIYSASHMSRDSSSYIQGDSANSHRIRLSSLRNSLQILNE
ncbi:G-protein coupled receptor 183-B [Denticeps clupeoides]|uniref:G protein-coupled receptor 183b n=1 Tax=Denticeps clupeoides TaxID=299321 RepID=A0AAY4E666_9TELE|nr:G-protein coupled receptor 183-like [Denticeps clupeoides]